MPAGTPPWVEPQPPWFVPVPAALCAGLPIQADDVPVVEILSAPCTLGEVVGIRAGRFVPLFGLGATRDEALRAIANIARALGPSADPRGPEHTLELTLHASLGTRPLERVRASVADRSAAPYCAPLALSWVGLLGGSDALRERVAAVFVDSADVREEAALALCVGGGDFGNFREHYASLSSSEHSALPSMRVARAWFDFVLARRLSAFDTLLAIAETENLDLASRWLITTAGHLHGDEAVRLRMAQKAEKILAPLRPILPRLTTLVAREMAELVQHSLALRFAHLRCAASRDHAAAAIRAWLNAATQHEADDPETSPHALGPEPSRAGRAAIEARTAAGEFLLDWFVPDREARDNVDSYARSTLRTYHRLRGAQLLAGVERELRPPGGMLTRIERLIWQQVATR